MCIGSASNSENKKNSNWIITRKFFDFSYSQQFTAVVLLSKYDELANFRMKTSKKERLNETRTVLQHNNNYL